MTPLGVIGDVYLVCCAVGTLYLLAGAFLGHFADGGGHGLHVDHSHGFGHSGHSHAHADLADLNPNPSKVAVIPDTHRGRATPARFILSLLSPMTIAVFLAFFGIAGIFALKIVPVLGAWSAVVAAIVGLLLTGQVMRVFGWMVRQMHVTSQPDTADLIGQRADVTVPIGPDRIGEVVFVVGLSRYNKSAKAVNPSASFNQGTKVIISDIDNNVVLVEPWKEFLLDDNSPTNDSEQK